MAEKVWKEHVSDLFRKQRVQLEPEYDITFKGTLVKSCFLQPGPMSYRCHRPQVEELSITEDTRLGGGGGFPFRPGLCFPVVLSGAATTVHREAFRSNAANKVKCEILWQYPWQRRMSKGVDAIITQELTCERNDGYGKAWIVKGVGMVSMGEYRPVCRCTPLTASPGDFRQPVPQY